MTYQRLRPTVKLTMLWPAIAVISTGAACDSDVMSWTERVPVRAQFREKGSACEVEVYYSNSVKGLPASLPSYYRLASGELAAATEDVPEIHCVVVTFPTVVAVSDVIRLGAGTAEEAVLSVSRNEADGDPAVFLGAHFMENATEPLVVLTFDDALDPEVATDVAHYSLQNTIEHPVTASATECGRQVELVFSVLAADTSIDIEDLTDVNGVILEDHSGVVVQVAEEEVRPRVESAVFPVNGSSAAVEVTFDEVVDQATAENTNNYMLIPGTVQPVSAEILPGGRTVLVGFAAIEPPVSIDVSGVLDLAGNPMDPVAELDVLEAEDETPPSIVSVSPVGRNAGLTLRVQFAEAVTPSSAERVTGYRLTGSSDPDGVRPTQAVLQSGGTAVDLTFDYIPDNATLEVADVTDLNGNVFGDTDAVPVDSTNDRIAPRIAQATFVPDATSASVDVAFDKAVDPSSGETATNYTFSTGANPTSATLQSDGRTVRLVTTLLSRQTTLAVANVMDTAGNLMETVSGQSIDSGGDSQPPLVSSATFLPDAPSPTVEVVFSEVVDQPSAESPTNYLSTADGQTPDTANLQSDGRTVLLMFGPMPLETDIEVSGVTDLSGNGVSASRIDIVPGGDDTAPTVESAQFVANASSPTVDVGFSEAVNKTLAEATGLYVMGTDLDVALSATLQDDGRTVRVVFPPVARTDGMEIRSITDMSGNVMTTVDGLGVAAAQESNEPVVVSAAYAANASSPTVTVEFSEAVDEGSAETVSNYLATTQALSPTSAVVQSDGHTVGLVFPRLIAHEVLVVNNVCDFAGNPVDGDIQIAIAPNAETTAPTIASVTVTNTSTITIVFSEAIDETSAETVNNYSGLPAGVSAQSATLQSDGKTVIVGTLGTALTAGNTINISGISDLNGNTMTAVTDLTMS